jgi:hypothetical protein
MTENNHRIETAESKYITVKESVLLTGKSIHTIRGLIKKKKITFIKEKDAKTNKDIVMIERNALLDIYPASTGTPIDTNPTSNTTPIKTKEVNEDPLNTTIHMLKNQLNNLNDQLKSKDAQLLSKDEHISKLLNTNMALNSHVLKLNPGVINDNDEMENAKSETDNKKGRLRNLFKIFTRN